MRRPYQIALGLVIALVFGIGYAWMSHSQIYTLNDSGSFIKLAPGTTTVAPLKFQSGPLLTSVTPGTMEYLDHTFYLTTYLVRRSIQLNQNIITTATTVSNTVAETQIYEVDMAPNYLTQGKVIIPRLYGIYWSANNHTFTLRLKKNGATLLTTTSTTSPSTAKPWEVMWVTTVITNGASGQLEASARLTQDATANMDALTAPVSIDTTLTNSFQITIQWDATGANSLRVNQGYTECVQ